MKYLRKGSKLGKVTALLLSVCLLAGTLGFGPLMSSASEIPAGGGSSSVETSSETPEDESPSPEATQPAEELPQAEPSSPPDGAEQPQDDSEVATDPAPQETPSIEEPAPSDSGEVSDAEEATPSPEPTDNPEEAVPEEDVSNPEDTEALEEEPTPAPTETPEPDAEPSEMPEPDAEASETPDPQTSEESSDPADAETIAEVTPAPSTAPSPVTTHGMHVIVRHWHTDGTMEEEWDDEHYLDSGSCTVNPKPANGEVFTSFSVSAGHDAVSFGPDGQTAIITYESNIPLVKVHVFYDKTPEQMGREFIGEDFEGVDNFYEIDTKEESGKKVYNTAEGLHTDKYASEIDGSDGRTFNVTLESWFAGENLADVGLVLDASGSMAFLSPSSTEKVTVSVAKRTELGIEPNTALTADQINAILDSHKTDNSKLGYSGYTYYVYDQRVSTNELVPLGYWDGKKIGNGITVKNNGNKDVTFYHAFTEGDVLIGSISKGNILNEKSQEDRAGWYYVNTVGHVNQIFNESTGTGKDLHSIVGESFPDSEDLDKDYGGNKNLVYLNGTSCALGNDESWKEAKSKGPSVFFVDNEGYLCCISDNGNLFESHVYKKDDATRIKAETLQHALGTFVNGLHDSSPKSLVSAVRFSTENYSNQYTDEAMRTNWEEKLVLQDWTNDPSESANMMSLLHRSGGGTGSAGANDSSVSSSGSDKHQYNYVLTGGTYAYTGLQAFSKELASDERLEAGNRNAKKYLIVFTDGKDQEVEEGDSNTKVRGKKAEEAADSLKNSGYTIYCVALTGGAYERDEEALEFLKKIATVDDLEPGQAGSHIQFGTSDPTTGGDGLDSAFEEILSQITYDLNEYNVQDYIDPRFDLVDYSTETPTVVHLNKDGNIVIGDVEKKLESVPADPSAAADKNKGQEIVLNSDPSLKADDTSATLYWDGNAGLYYLQWANVDIPGCSKGSDGLDIWRSVVTIRAKDDFIGGNAVLTNGTSQNQNMVYNVKDTNANSGTGDMWQKPEEGGGHAGAVDGLPSKGFPRPTVNVTLLPRDIDMKQTIYLGETIDPKDIARQLAQSLSEDDSTNENGTTSKGSHYYWEFLERYASYHAKDDYKDSPDPLTALLTDIIKAGENGKNIKYSYLPVSVDDDYTLTGGDSYQEDILGTLTYTWKVISNNNVDKENPFVTTTIGDVQYGLYVNYGPYKDENLQGGANTNQEHKNDGMVKDENYQKPQTGVGDEVTNPEKEGKGTHTTKIVHGEIALQVQVPADDLKTAFEEIGINRLTITVSLERSYSGKPATPAPSIAPLTVTLTQRDIDSAGEHGTISKFTDPANAQQLPIGKYTATLSVDNKKAKDYLHFVLGYGEDSAYDKSHFSSTVVDSGDDIKDFRATQLTGEKGFILGSEDVPTKDQTKDIALETEDYLNKRVGILLVTGNMGQMTVSKTVTGAGGDKKKDWNFRVELSEKINGPYGDMAFTNGVATFTLKHDESKTAVGIPVGATYTVTEVEANQDGYTTTKTGDTGTIPQDEIAEVKFTNDKPTPTPTVPADLKVTKTVTGMGDRTRDFHFRVELSDTGINGTYGDMTFEDGVAEFTLKNGESKTATGLPPGIKYKVTELEANQYGYTTTPAVGYFQGTIPPGETAEVEFVNDMPYFPPYLPPFIQTSSPTPTPMPTPTITPTPTPVPPITSPPTLTEPPVPPSPPTDTPQTGDGRDIIPWLAACGISALGIVLTSNYMKKSKHRNSRR